MISSKYRSTSDFSSLRSRSVALLDFEEFLGMVLNTFSRVVLDVLILYFQGRPENILDDYASNYVLSTD